MVVVIPYRYPTPASLSLPLALSHSRSRSGGKLGDHKRWLCGCHELKGFRLPLSLSALRHFLFPFFFLLFLFARFLSLPLSPLPFFFLAITSCQISRWSPSLLFLLLAFLFLLLFLSLLFSSPSPPLPVSLLLFSLFISHGGLPCERGEEGRRIVMGNLNEGNEKGNKRSGKDEMD